MPRYDALGEAFAFARAFASRSATSMLPFSSVFTTTILNPAIAADATRWPALLAAGGDDVHGKGGGFEIVHVSEGVESHARVLFGCQG